MPTISSQPTCCHTPTANSSIPARPGSQNRSMMCGNRKWCKKDVLDLFVSKHTAPIHVEVKPASLNIPATHHNLFLLTCIY